MNKLISPDNIEMFHPSITRLFRSNWVAVTAILLFHIAVMFVERTIALVTIWLCIFFLLQTQGKQIIGLQKPKQWTWWILAPVIGAAAVSVTALILWGLVGWTESNMFYDMAHAVGTGFNLLGNQAPLWSRFALLGFAWLSSPFLEEPLFRGFAQSVYGEKIGLWYSIILQAVLFVIVHPLNSISWLVSIFFAGVIYGVVTKQSGSIWVATLAHMTYNLGILWISFNFMPEYIF